MARLNPTQFRSSESTEVTSCQKVFSIGHSNLALDEFLVLLEEFRISVLVDVRSSPYSRYAPQFNQEQLRSKVVEHRIKYVYLGGSLGGRPLEDEFYDSNGRVDYAMLASSTRFKLGLEKLKTYIASSNCMVAVMCGEENPLECHRRLLIGRVLAEEGIKMLHIRADRSCEEELTYRSNCPRQSSIQKSLFDCVKENEWKSTRSVSRGERRKTSSPF